jgi:hypothetical protein
VNKLLENSMVKTINEYPIENFENINMNFFNEYSTSNAGKDKLDLNFIYSNNLFSNFINFNIEEINKKEEKNNLNNLTHANVENNNLFEDINKEFKSIKQDTHHDVNKNKKNSTKNEDDFLTKITLKKIIPKIQNFSFDEATEIELNSLISERLMDKQTFKKMNVRIILKLQYYKL